MNGKVKDLIGLKGVAAFHTFHTLLLTYYMSPVSGYNDKQYADFLKDFSKFDDDKKKEAFKIALTLGEFSTDELQALFDCYDMAKEEINALGVDKILEILSNVCVEIAKIKVFF